MRRSGTVVIDATLNGQPGRDNGGVFTLTEMAAEPAIDWFMRAMQFLVRSGVDVPPTIFEAGPAGMAAMGIGTMLTGLSKAPWYEVKPLLAELLTCVTSYTPPGAQQPVRGWDLIKTQIEEPATMLRLYEEVVSLSLGFSLVARLSSYRTLAMTMVAAFTPNTGTSNEGSAALSAPGTPV